MDFIQNRPVFFVGYLQRLNLSSPVLQLFHNLLDACAFLECPRRLQLSAPVVAGVLSPTCLRCHVHSYSMRFPGVSTPLAQPVVAGVIFPTCLL